MSGYTHSDLCDVYLCSMPIQQRASVGSALNVLSFFASASRSVCGQSWEKHWLLVFDYGEDEVLICDADMDHAGDLTGRRSWKKRAAFKEAYPNKRHLGKHRIPESRIEKLMKKMCDSGRYHLTANNCQKWARDLLLQLGIQPPVEERDAESVVSNVIQPTALWGTVLFSVGVLGALIFGGSARRNNRD